MAVWSATKAKNHLNESEGRQMVRRGNQTFYVMTIEDFDTGRLPHAASERSKGFALALARKQGWNDLEMDALIAATALIHGMPVATLNRKHFERRGVELVTF